MAATIITVAQQKGGAGKTTLVAHLAVSLTSAGKKVAVVDIDPQQSLSTWYAVRKQRFGDSGAGLLANQIQGWRTQKEVESLARSHDIVLIDSPPHMETEARIAIRSADLVVVPVQPSPMDVWATKPTLELAKSEGRNALVVFNRVPPRAKLVGEMEKEIKSLGATVAKARLGSRVAFAAALAEGQAVNEAQPRSKASLEMASLAKEILKKAR